MTNQINSPLYVQEYFASREGYRCGRCGGTRLRYAGEPHADSVGRVCEPPNKLIDDSPVQATGNGPVAGALPELGEKTEEVKPAEEDVTIEPAEHPDEGPATIIKLNDETRAAAERKAPKSWSAVKPLKLNSNGDIDA